MRLSMFILSVYFMCSLAITAQAAEESADLDEMIEAVETKIDTEAQPSEPAVETVQNNPEEGASQNTEEQPEVSDLETTQNPEADIAENRQATIDEMPDEEEEVAVEVFSPEFMASLQVCRTDSETKDGRTFQIRGMRNGKCYLTYGNYILNVPTSLLSSIHGFDDLQAFLKNTDMTRYKYLPEYTYEGIAFALDACAHKEKYYGVEEEEQRVDATVVRGISADYIEDRCEIYLQNELELENETRDYGVTCRLPQTTIDELEPYFTDIVKKYENLDTTEMHKHKEIREADIALMYYLQQNNYCRKNNELLK